MYPDYIYMIRALDGKGCSVPDPQIRHTLKKLGYMVEATLRQCYGGNKLAHGMTLTKKGQRRAVQIAKDMNAQYRERVDSLNRRGNRGAAWPKSWKDPNRLRYW